MNEKVMVVENIEDILNKAGTEVIGKFCSNSSGDSVRVKNPRGSNLKERWGELEEGMAYKFIMGEYKPKDSDQSFPYVQDFKLVAAEIAEKAPKLVATQVRQYTKSDDTNRSIIRQVSWKTAGREVEALIGVKYWSKEELTIPKIIATQKKLANAGVEWIMSSHEVATKIAEKLQEETKE